MIKKSLIFIAISLMLLVPATSFAAGLVPPCGVDPVTQKCIWGFNEFMILINTVIQFILFKMVVPIAAIMFAYAGFLLVTSGGETSKRTKAKTIFTNVAIGLIVAIAAWLIINTILSILGYKGDWIGF
ncbi:hypothetical protein A2911_02290 [Candidatus Nomurabacteria bacterium RIFCSPLOWO2_01_FULL_40_15]|uniref:Uncharacterized protein n=1 Tax=Candidatus Nomurabacteria bacterium RIFCSPLOWO2_01_FULL_40_15 TaxID=1801772 RepID=A0A1F6X7V7_9BACT|nr:MAG: hypothetical protein A2911_02290 [Candidatus Nomurabacteria bacterium RIFCSPLOWO2_01_FULL_40_15]